MLEEWISKLEAEEAGKEIADEMNKNDIENYYGIRWLKL